MQDIAAHSSALALKGLSCYKIQIEKTFRFGKLIDGIIFASHSQGTLDSFSLLRLDYLDTYSGSKEQICYQSK